MGRVTTPAYRIEYTTSPLSRTGLTSACWNSRFNGRANEANLVRHVQGLLASFQPGGVNHYPDMAAPVLTRVQLVRQRDSVVVAEVNVMCPGCGETAPEPGSYCSECHSKPVDGEFTREQLDRAFKLVRPERHWKDPIRRIIPAEAAMEHGVTYRAIRYAIQFYTGSVAEVTPLPDGRAHVQAIGYYAAVGA